jgi:hypothetical protein
MSATDKLTDDKLAAMKTLWIYYRKTFLARGVDPAQSAIRQKNRLSSPEAIACVEELCKDGCALELLVGILGLFRLSPWLERVWSATVGDPKKRKKVSRVLEKTVSMFEDVFRDILAAEDDSVREEYSNFERIPLSRLVSELRLYVSFLNLGENLLAEMETRSFQEFLKYVLAGYVKRATGRYHDRSVSALLSDVVGPQDFDEVAQRMWRSRNFKRLDKRSSKVIDFLFTLGIAIARTA